MSILLVQADEVKIINRNPSKYELKGLNKESYTGKNKDRRCGSQKYTDDELLSELRRFEKEFGRLPTMKDFNENNNNYPVSSTYQVRFGSWSNALKLAGFVKQGEYTDDELLDKLRIFENEHRRPPVLKDFTNNPKYPGFKRYFIRFGNWLNALKLAGLDIDLMGKQCCSYRGRQAEITVLNHFKQHPVDLAGDNPGSHCDGICPNGKFYDVKSSKLKKGGKCYQFNIKNKYKEDIELFYLLAFNKDYTELEHGWRIPGEIVEKDYFLVGTCGGEFNIENMKEFDITDKFKDILNIKEI